MRNRLFFSIAAVALSVLAASALYAGDARYGAEVPFDFVVKGKELPKGAYTIRVNERGVVLLENRDGYGSAAATTIPVTETNATSGIRSAKLVFEQRAGINYLTEIWSVYDEGLEVVGKKRRASEVARNDDEIEIVEVALAR